MLIGADYLWSFQEGTTIRVEPNDPVAIETRLDWVLWRPCRDFAKTRKSKFCGTCHAMEMIENQKNAWPNSGLQTLGILEDNEVHEGLKNAIIFNGERYVVSLPWKEGIGPLPRNQENSMKRLKGQMERLKENPDILKTYDAIIREQEENGIIERVAELDAADRVHYLPHHAVIRKNAKTTKVRIEYDACSKEGKHGVSLNDCLHVGPALSPLFYAISIQFQEKCVALVGDIGKAFLNIVVNKRDRDCLRFLWVTSVDSERLDPIAYRFCHVVFGINCSAFLLNVMLQYHLDSFTELDPEFVCIMKRSSYVDDHIMGRKTIQETSELYDKATSRLAEGGFKLRKWLTNSEELRAEITQHELRRESSADSHNWSEHRFEK